MNSLPLPGYITELNCTTPQSNSTRSHWFKNIGEMNYEFERVFKGRSHEITQVQKEMIFGLIGIPGCASAIEIELKWRAVH